jgi:hypothetical protein
MGKLIILPGVDLNPPSRAELVDEISEMMMKEIAVVFVEQKFEPGCLAEWHRQVRDYFWRVDIQLVERDFRPQDVRRWTHHWRNTVLNYIGSKRIR